MVRRAYFVLLAALVGTVALPTGMVHHHSERHRARRALRRASRFERHAEAPAPLEAEDPHDYHERRRRFKRAMHGHRFERSDEKCCACKNKEDFGAGSTAQCMVDALPSESKGRYVPGTSNTMDFADS